MKHPMHVYAYAEASFAPLMQPGRLKCRDMCVESLSGRSARKFQYGQLYTAVRTLWHSM